MNDDSLHTYAAPITVRTTFTAIKLLFASEPIPTFSGAVTEAVDRAMAGVATEAAEVER